MPKFYFIEEEYISRVVTFEANNLEHAKTLMEEATVFEDLPNVETDVGNGDTTWLEVQEAEK